MLPRELQLFFVGVFAITLPLTIVGIPLGGYGFVPSSKIGLVPGPCGASVPKGCARSLPSGSTIVIEQGNPSMLENGASQQLNFGDCPAAKHSAVGGTSPSLLVASTPAAGAAWTFANWSVPSAPPASGNQLIFIEFELRDGMGNVAGTMLQWGSNPGGPVHGGQFWSAYTWVFFSGNSSYVVSEPLTVTAGDELISSMRADFKGHWEFFIWDLQSMQNSSLKLFEFQPMVAAIMLVAYDLTSCASLPGSSVLFTHIVLFTNTLEQITPAWTTENQATLFCSQNIMYTEDDSNVTLLWITSGTGTSGSVQSAALASGELSGSAEGGNDMYISSDNSATSLSVPL